MLIQTTSDLVNFIANMGSPPYITLDTEFISEKTYAPQLCLIQIASGSRAAVIDPLSDIDLQPLIVFLMNPNIVKVLHAAEQDLGILWNEFGVLPTPIFDTQIAAMVCGFGDQVSYGQLVNALTKTKLDKSSQIVDWSRRPLLDRHIEYALGDVSHLGPVYERLKKDIEKRDRGNWIKEEMLELSDSKRYIFNPELHMRKLKARGMSRRRLATLRELVSWRDERARDQNIPRGWVLKDLALRDIVSHPPQNAAELGRVRGIGGIAQGQIGREILQHIQAAAALPLAECPPLDTEINDNSANENAVVLLRALLKHVCRLNKVASKLVAATAELEQIALGLKTRVDQGWRWDVFGKFAHELLAGAIALGLEKGSVKIVKIMGGERYERS
ncbi:MAG: ribonuclease D [Candidatus Marinimicrobia bacterium]|nr:ribonuclease D [Candidatus Neomarinimicrobiota bacterium]